MVAIVTSWMQINYPTRSLEYRVSMCISARAPFCSEIVKTMAELTAQRHGKAVLITGDTKLVKDLLRSQGGRWSGSMTGWFFQASKWEAVVGALRQAGHEIKNAREAQPEPTSKRRKTETGAVAAAAAAAASDKTWSILLAPGEPSGNYLRRIVVSKFYGKAMVDIREFYRDADVFKPTKKGIKLKTEEWRMLEQAIPEINAELKRLRDV